MVLGMCAGWTLLSAEFTWGERHALRPIPAMVALWGLGWIGWVAAAKAAARAGSARGLLTTILVVGAAGRLLLWPSALIQEDDPYRYLLDGTLVVHRVNPFTVRPADLQAGAGLTGPDGIPASLAEALRAPAGRRILDRVSHPDLRTLYPPLALASFAAGAWVSPWGWKGQRLMALAADVLCALAILGLLRALGRPAAWLVLYWWNPLILKEVANAAHVDVLAAAALVAAAACLATRAAMGRPVFFSALAGACVAAAGLTKLVPAVVLPVTAAAAWRLGGSVALVSHLAAAGGLFALGWLPFANAGPGLLTETLGVYLARWRRNGGVFPLLESFIGGPGAGAVAALALLVPACLLAWRVAIRPARERIGEGLIAAMVTLLAVRLLTGGAVFPWYAVPVLALAAARPRPLAWVASLALAAYYALFLIEYRLPPERQPPWTAALLTAEHLALWAALLWPARATRG